MPALNFKPQFVEPIRARTKRHTIRASRKQAVLPGQLLHLFCGMRTKNCFRILPHPVQCTKVESISIDRSPALMVRSPFTIRIDGNLLHEDECERLAVADGFPDFKTMMAFWEGRLPFKGQIIHWR